MRIAPDTNILVRMAVHDDPAQSAQALGLVEQSEAIILTLPALCEFAWVIRGRYRLHAHEASEAIRELIGTEGVVVDRDAVAAGLVFLDSGGDFADGVIAHLGHVGGADAFASFDRKAVQILRARGGQAILLGAES